MIKSIFISPSLSKNKFGEIIFSTRVNYFEYFQKLGLYCTSSFVSKRKEIKKIANNSRALILCGGGNIYKIEKKKINFIRDKFEISLMKEFIKKGKPIIAICRGFQLVASKTKSKILKVKNHVKRKHVVNIVKKNKFIRDNSYNTNSFHDFAIKDLDKNFQINGVTRDGSIEIATNFKKKILCLMFHPERENISKSKINEIILRFLYGINNFSSWSRKKN